MNLHITRFLPGRNAMVRRLKKLIPLLGPSYFWESADDSPSPGGEGRGEGGHIFFPPGLDFTSDP
jgi:hypothetical protein